MAIESLVFAFDCLMFSVRWLLKLDLQSKSKVEMSVGRRTPVTLMRSTYVLTSVSRSIMPRASLISETVLSSRSLAMMVVVGLSSVMLSKERGWRCKGEAFSGQQGIYFSPSHLKGDQQHLEKRLKDIQSQATDKFTKSLETEYGPLWQKMATLSVGSLRFLISRLGD